MKKEDKPRPTHLVFKNDQNTACGRQRSIFIMVVSTNIKEVTCKRCIDIYNRKQDPLKYI